MVSESLNSLAILYVLRRMETAISYSSGALVNGLNIHVSLCTMKCICLNHESRLS